MNGMKRSKTKIAVAAMALVCISSLPSMAANKLIVKDSTGTTDKFVITDLGYIGVGNSAPASAIDIIGTTGSGTQIKSQYTGTSATGSTGMLFLRNNPNGTDSLPLSANRLGFIGFGGVSGTTAIASSAIVSSAADNWSSTSTPSFYSFETTPSGSTTRAERMRITSSGNIGFGTTAPSQKVEVNGGLRLNTNTAKPTCDSTSRGTIWFTKGGTGVADKLEVCAKQADENYAWKPLF